jgi:DNA-binding XRE family transcriptional regulator
MIAVMAKKRTSTPWTPKRLKALRARLKLTQGEAAAKIGVAMRTWINWENEHRTPTSTAAVLIDLLSQGKL